MYIKSVSSFAESMNGLNACMCCVCACLCVCVNQYVCCICIVLPRPMCVQVPMFMPTIIGLSNDVYTHKYMYIKSVSLSYV